MKSVSQENKSSWSYEKVPEIDSGITRIECDADTPIFQAILGKNLSLTGKALWIDSGNTSSTYALASQGDENILQRVRIGRAFTEFQHHHLINRIEEFLTPETNYLVIPNIDQQYKKSGASSKEVKDLFGDVLSKILAVKRDRAEIKIIYSFASDDGSAINMELRNMTENVVRIEENSHGLENSSNKREKMFYQAQGAIQTTMPFWTKSVRETVDKTPVVKNGENKFNV